jgi:uncharacterized membrane protein
MSVDPQDHRNTFQLERLILFTDAVFAIAITLLVIEIKVPELHGEGVTDLLLGEALKGLIPKFLGFLVSFFLIGMYWTIHHRLFGFVRRLNTRLLILNLLFVFTIVLMPFSTGIFGEYSRPSTVHLKVPLIIYVANIACAALANYLLWRYVGNPAHEVSHADLDPVQVRNAKRRALIIPAVFLLVIPIAFIDPILARYVPILIPVALRVSRRKTTPPVAAAPS